MHQPPLTNSSCLLATNLRTCSVCIMYSHSHDVHLTVICIFIIILCSGSCIRILIMLKLWTIYIWHKLAIQRMNWDIDQISCMAMYYLIGMYFSIHACIKFVFDLYSHYLSFHQSAGPTTSRRTQSQRRWMFDLDQQEALGLHCPR